MTTEVDTEENSEAFTYQNYNDATNSSEDSDSQQEPNFGLLFDVDGVLGRGLEVLPQAAEAFKLLCDPDRKELRVPVALVTNACSDATAKVQMISKWFDIKIHPDQLIQAPSPLSVYKEYHDKCVLFIGQGNIIKLANDLGFTNVVTLDDVRAAYPLLDMVDHEQRRAIINNIPTPKPMKRIEAIILTGEPTRWESSLQLLVDLLMTDGKPDEVPETYPEDHLPVIACNMDLVYMDKAALPRFGHGAFLICLQTLYNQLTGYKLRYTSLLGKPSEITFRFAEHVLTLTSKRMGYKRPIDRLFFFGDNPDVDVLGSNLYNNFLRRFRHCSGGDKSPTEGHSQYKKVSVAQSRTVPPDAAFLPQTAKGIDSLLVRTGVYKPTDKTRVHYCHRDFQGAADLVLPTFEVEDCFEGVQLILNMQKFHPYKQSTN
ncbi:Haloacid dehalogenase-like hydrolase domain-containing 5 [Schistosoma japonicum]|nr:Haloacid dehalogenase-like hydrolase domain-containing 5 [Schistosoma japonicum]